jgi:hypothetical protein
MRKLLPIIILSLLPFTHLFSQEIEVEQAIRSSQNIYQGSARFMGMGGAFTALGGDISAVSLNPAGVGVYTGLQFVFTPSFQQQSMESTTPLRNNLYSQDARNYKVNLNNLGISAAYNLPNSVNWKNINIALGYNTMNNFNREVEASNYNLSQSKMHEFVANANQGIWRSAYEQLAWETWVLDYDSTYFNEYYSFVVDAINQPDSIARVGVDQFKNLKNEGSLGEYYFAAGANYNDKLYLGLSIGIQRSQFTYENTYTESERDDQIRYFNSLNFTQYENHSGTGYNFKVGAIYRPLDFLRIGAAYHSPTFFSNMEYSWHNELTYVDDSIGTLSTQSEESTFAYRVTTPSKFTGGVALRIAQTAMVSADYERVDYGQARLDDKDTNVPFNYENDSIQNTFGVAHNFRFGGEVKLKSFYLRLGYALYDSPYSDRYKDYQSKRVIYSGGIGYREQGFFIDATFLISRYSTEEKLFTTIPNFSDVDFTNNRLMVTVGLRF